MFLQFKIKLFLWRKSEMHEQPLNLQWSVNRSSNFEKRFGSLKLLDVSSVIRSKVPKISLQLLMWHVNMEILYWQVKIIGYFETSSAVFRPLSAVSSSWTWMTLHDKFRGFWQIFTRRNFKTLSNAKWLTYRLSDSLHLWCIVSLYHMPRY